MPKVHAASMKACNSRECMEAQVRGEYRPAVAIVAAVAIDAVVA